MLARWPIRYKVLLGIALLLVIVATLAISSLRGVYAYRGLAKNISRRATELPLAQALAGHVSDLRVTLSHTRQLQDFRSETAGPPVDTQFLRERFRTNFQAVRESLRRYGEQLQYNEQAAEGSEGQITDSREERETVAKIERSLSWIDELNRDQDWMLDEVKVDLLGEELEKLHNLSGELPSFLQGRMHNLAGEVRTQYHAWIALSWFCSAAALAMLGVLLRFFYMQIFLPLKVLVRGSRRVAAGQFNYRIHLDTQDEMADLAAALNAMTDRFQQIRDDLDRQVRQRTLEVVRNEQLASVGVLAAGVAHEINNPLASIAFCAEALESRLQDIIQADDARPDEEHNEEVTVLKNYLRMIQDEAFRSKEITERLLDFSRQGTSEKHHADLVELVEGVIDIVRHLGKYRGKEIELVAPAPVIARINPQEMKQVVLNLVTNALEALQTGGTVTIQVRRTAEQVELIVSDDGCGMTEEVLAHIFEPFYTTRAEGQGTGLGLAITHRIIADHGGRIEAVSDGPGRGSQFRVSLPVETHEEEHQNQYQAA